MLWVYNFLLHVYFHFSVKLVFYFSVLHKTSHCGSSFSRLNDFIQFFLKCSFMLLNFFIYNPGMRFLPGLSFATLLNTL